MIQIVDAEVENVRRKEAERRKLYRQQRIDLYNSRRGKGFVMVQIWIHKDDRESLNDYAEWLRERKGYERIP